MADARDRGICDPRGMLMQPGQEMTPEVTSPSPAYALAVAGVDGGSVTIEDLSFASPDATFSM